MSILCINTDLDALRLVDQLDPGERILIIEADPLKVAAFPAGGDVTLLCGSLVTTSDRFAPVISPGRQLMSAALHPSELYPLFAEPNAPLPEPRTLVVRGFDLAKALNDWARFEQILLTVGDDEEAKRALEWFGAGWRIRKADGYTVWATRLF